MNAYILAGGQSSRMGSDKTELMWKGKRLVNHMIDIASRVCSQVVVVGKADVEGVSCIPDTVTGGGPASGIHSAMKDQADGPFLVLACDMPLMNEQWLLELIEQSAKYRVTLTSSKRGLEPLCAVYTAELAVEWEKGMLAGIRKLTDLIAMCEPDFGIAHLPFHYAHDVLLNVNRPDDFIRLKQSTGI